MTEGSSGYNTDVLYGVSEDQIVDGTFIIPDDIKEMGYAAFKGLKNLEKVIIPDSVEKIESSAFFDCQNLSEVIMSKNIKDISSVAFKNCYSLRYLIIPSSLGILSDFAFPYCKSLHLILKTSLFKTCNSRGENSSLQCCSKTIKVFDTFFDEGYYIDNDKLKPIRKRELKFRLETILKGKGINVKSFYSANKDINDFIDSVINKIDLMYNYNYREDLQKYINDYLSKNSIVVKTFKAPTIFDGQTKTQIYNFINEYNPENIDSKDIDVLRNYSKSLEDYPTYISGQFLQVLIKKKSFNSEIKQITKFLNNISKSVNRNSILKKIFFKKENENSNELSLDTEMLEKICNFIQNELNELETEIELFNFLKQIVALYIEKREKQVNILNNSLDEVEVIETENNNKKIMNSSDKNTYDDAINSEINKLNQAIEFSLVQYQDINNLLSFDIVVSNELTGLLKDVLPNLIAHVASCDGINQRKEILEDITTIKNTLNSMILGDNKLQVSENNLAIELKEKVNEIMERQHIKIK